MDGFHVERVPEDKRNPFAGTQIGQPVPSEDTFDTDNQISPVGCNGFEKWFGASRHVPVQHDLAVLTQDTAVHGAGMQIDAAVQWVLLGGESPEVSSSCA